MRLSKYFLPILKENPKDAEIVSHRLMARAGMLLPLLLGHLLDLGESRFSFTTVKQWSLAHIF